MNLFKSLLKSRPPLVAPVNGSTMVMLIGNCQTDALVRTISAMAPSVDVLGSVSVMAAELADHESPLIAADVILAQSIAEDYPIEWLRRSQLVDAFGDKVVFIPNAYFSGYTPEMTYIHGDGARHVVPGPLGDYHLAPIILGYQKGLIADQVVDLYNDRGFFEQNYSGNAEASLAELARRDVDLDVKISDFVAERYKERRLFNTMNHPTAYTLVEIASRILTHLGIKHYDIREVMQDDYLSAIIKAPAMPVHEMLGLKFNNPPVDRAFDLGADFKPNGKIRYYDLPELIGAFYKVYDNHREIVMQFPVRVKQ